MTSINYYFITHLTEAHTTTDIPQRDGAYVYYTPQVKEADVGGDIEYTITTDSTQANYIYDAKLDAHDWNADLRVSWIAPHDGLEKAFTIVKFYSVPNSTVVDNIGTEIDIVGHYSSHYSNDKFKGRAIFVRRGMDVVLHQVKFTIPAAIFRRITQLFDNMGMSWLAKRCKGTPEPSKPSEPSESL